MDMQELINKHSLFLKRHFLPIALGLLGLIFFVYGLIVLLGSARVASSDILFESQEVFNKGVEKGSLSSEKSIFVDVEGAVLRPGVYNLTLEGRVKDALVAAGGLSARAEREWVEKNLNLAQKLSDGAKIYIPETGENIKDGKYVGIGIENPLKGQINLNTTDIEELDRLQGVGIVTAQKIIDSRPYSSIDELLSKKIVGSKVFEKIKEKITVY